LVAEHHLLLPILDMGPMGEESAVWFPVPGMYGGFKYWLEEHDAQLTLTCESWCRVASGSGQRHAITEEGVTLVDERFV
jgi:hypothetical protein